MAVRELQAFIDTSTGLFRDNTAAEIGADDMRDLADSVQNVSRWREIATTAYTATPASTSSITLSNTAGCAVGLPVRYVYGGVSYYGVITAVVTNTSITIAGAPLNTGVNLTSLSIGSSELVIQAAVFIAATYGDGAADLLSADMNAYSKWQLSRAYLVRFEATHKTADTGSQPKINVKIGGSAVSTQDSNNGIQLSTSGTWVSSSAVAISTTNYVVDNGDAIEVACTVAGTNGDAADLSVNLIFVLE